MAAEHQEPTVTADFSTTQMNLVVAEIEGSSSTSTTCLSLAGQLRWLLFILTLTGTVVDESLGSLDDVRRDLQGTNSGRAAARTMRLFAARFLVSLIVLQSFALVVGKIAFFEVIWIAEDLGYSVVYTTLVFAAGEAATQLVAGASVPRLYTLIHRDSRLHLNGLTQISIVAYVISAAIACVAYPILGVCRIVYGGTPALFYTLAAVQVVQYSFVVGAADQAFEMSYPHLLATFEGHLLVMPGFRFPCSSRCQRATAASGYPIENWWGKNLTAQATSDSLAYFLTLSRFMCTAIFTLIYISADKAGSLTLRWAMLVCFSYILLYSSSTLFRGYRKVKCGLRHDVIEANHNAAAWLWNMRLSEIALAVFAAVIFTVPADAVLASFAVLYLAVGSLFLKLTCVVGQ